MAEQRQARTVRNKDIALIQDVPYLKIEIESLEQRRMWERERMRSVTQHLSGVAGGGGVPKGLDDAFARLSEAEEQHRKLIKTYTRQIQKAEAIINSIASQQMKTLVTMLYLDKIPGSEVQKKMGMSRWVFDAARKTIEDAESMEDVVWHDRYTNGAL